MKAKPSYKNPKLRRNSEPRPPNSFRKTGVEQATREYQSVSVVTPKEVWVALATFAVAWMGEVKTEALSPALEFVKLLQEHRDKLPVNTGLSYLLEKFKKYVEPEDVGARSSCALDIAQYSMQLWSRQLKEYIRRLVPNGQDAGRTTAATDSEPSRSIEDAAGTRGS